MIEREKEKEIYLLSCMACGYKSESKEVVKTPRCPQCGNEMLVDKMFKKERSVVIK